MEGVRSDFWRSWLPARQALKQLVGLRSLYHLVRSVADLATTRPTGVAAVCERTYRGGDDPWTYRDEAQQMRYRRALAMISDELHGRQSPNVLEVGCGEGMFTALLAPLCGQLLATDAAPTALDRARRRLGDVPQVMLRRLDVLTDSLGSGFDVIVMDHLIDLFGRRSAYRQIAARLAAALKPDGVVLIGAMRAFDLAERAWWAPLLPWGGVAILAWIGRNTALVPVTTVTESFYTYTLFRRRT